MSRPGFRPALYFAMLVAVPLALLRGVIPFTHTLIFVGPLQITVVGSPSAGDITLDLVRAMGISLGLTLAFFLALTVPFVSLNRAFGSVADHDAGLRMMLYRAWLLPLTNYGLVFYLGAWMLPPPLVEHAVFILLTVELLPLLLLFIAMRSTARICHGVGPFVSMIVVLVPLALAVLTQLIAEPIVSPLLPPDLPRN